MRVLVIEDDASIARALERVLVRLGASHVDKVATAGEAITKLLNEAYAVVTCDWVLAAGDGGQVYEWVLKNEPDPQPKFIFITSHQVHDHWPNALWIEKPCTSLSESLKALL